MHHRRTRPDLYPEGAGDSPSLTVRTSLLRFARSPLGLELGVVGGLLVLLLLVAAIARATTWVPPATTERLFQSAGETAPIPAAPTPYAVFDLRPLPPVGAPPPPAAPTPAPHWQTDTVNGPALARIVQGTLEPGNRGVDRLLGGAYATDGARSYVEVTISGNAGLTFTEQKRGLESDAFAVIKNLYLSGLPIGEVKLHGTFSSTPGGEEEVFRVRLTAQNAQFVRWGQLGLDDFWDYCDEVWWNPAWY